MIKGYKIRIYPTKQQEELIWKHIHASRFIWNYMLALQEDNYKNGGKYISEYNMYSLLPSLKKEKEYIWLNEVSSSTLQRVCSDLNEGYQMFFKGFGHPNFKSRKRSKKTYPVCCNRFYFLNDTVQIQKLGSVKYKTDFKLPIGRGCKFYNVRISFTNDKYILSFGMLYEKQVHGLTNDVIGIDLGIKELATVACENNKYVFHNINKSNRMKSIEKHLKYYQRIVSRKYNASYKRTGEYKKSHNIDKYEKKLKKLYAQRTNIRINYIHQITHYLISLFPKRIVMENLCLIGMMKNKHLSRAVQEQCLAEFIRQIKYKCEWNGIEFIQADRFYPSSKTCSRCGAVKKDLKLSDRVFVCNECGLNIDRDYNAAINLMKYTI